MSVVLPGRGFFFVLNSVRVPNILLLTYTQIFVELPLPYPPGLPGTLLYRGLSYQVSNVKHILGNIPLPKINAHSFNNFYPWTNR